MTIPLGQANTRSRRVSPQPDPAANQFDQATNRLNRIAARQDGIVTAAQCRMAGVTRADIAQRCRSGNWQRIFRGAYFITGFGETTGANIIHPISINSGKKVHERARIRAALLTLGPDATAVLTSAAYLHDFPVLPSVSAVQVCVPAEQRRLNQFGLVARQLVMAEQDITVIDGMRVTTPARTAADLVLSLSWLEVVSLLNGALRVDLLSPASLAAVERLIRGRRNAVRGRQALTVADGRAASPLETRIRLICADAGLPPEELQYVIRDDSGQVLAIADLAWPSRRLLVEADGASVHGIPDALHRDRRRQNELVARGYTVVRFTWADTMHPGYIASAVRRALRQGATTAR